MRRPFTQLKLCFFQDIVNRQYALTKKELRRIHEGVKQAQDLRRMDLLIHEVQLQLCFESRRPVVKPVVDVAREGQKYYQAMIAHALKLTNNRDDAMDLVQDTYLRAQEKAHLYNEQGDLKGWLYIIMKNIFFGQTREKKKMPTDLQPDYLEYHCDVNGAFDSIMRADAIKALESLPITLSTVAKMYFIDQTKYGMISKTLNLPLGTVKCRIFQARKALRGKLKEYAL